MQSKSKDNATTGTVAPMTEQVSLETKVSSAGTAKKIKKLIEGLLQPGIAVLTTNQPTTLRGKGYDDSVSTDRCDGVVDGDSITDAEGHAIMALRDWSRAARDPEFQRTMTGWYVMRTEIDLLREGKLNLEEARQIVGNAAALDFYTCIQTADYILKRLSQEEFADDGLVYRDTETFADFEAWQLLFHETAGLLKGEKPLRQDVAAQPELHAATKAIKAWIIANRAEAKAKKAGGAER